MPCYNSCLGQDIKSADWSENVAPFWPAVIQSALTWRGFVSLLRSGELLCPIRPDQDTKYDHARVPLSLSLSNPSALEEE